MSNNTSQSVFKGGTKIDEVGNDPKCDGLQKSRVHPSVRFKTTD